jgi:hypothetical protein
MRKKKRNVKNKNGYVAEGTISNSRRDSNSRVQLAGDSFYILLQWFA